MIKQIVYVYCFLISFFSYGQTVNKGGLYILPNTEFSTYFSFENLSTAQTFNNGVMYLYSDFINDGLYDFKEEKKENSKIIFSSDTKQTIQGNVIPRVYNLVFDNTSNAPAFVVSSGLIASGEVDFRNGIVSVPSETKSITFENKAKVKRVSDESHVEGWVDKIGNTHFTFPIGDKGYSRNSTISAPKEISNIVASRYVFEAEEFFNVHSNKSDNIELINSKEYWEVYLNKEAKGSIILTLSWDERTTLEELLKTALEELHILRWDVQEKMWMDEGGIVDYSNQTVTTPTEVQGFGYFTLGKVKGRETLPDDVIVYNLVTTNGDDKNDFFFIENIDKFPNNKLEIYNRWGVKIFEASGYDNVNHVFDGRSSKGAGLRSGKLPTGTYYYILKYMYEKDGRVDTVKKSGYLHLENN
ncbi:gliding motility-associated C-terminal domain-containing protein [Myroides odoratus]